MTTTTVSEAEPLGLREAIRIVELGNVSLRVIKKRFLAVSAVFTVSILGGLGAFLTLSSGWVVSEKARLLTAYGLLLAAALAIAAVVAFATVAWNICVRLYVEKVEQQAEKLEATGETRLLRNEFDRVLVAIENANTPAETHTATQRGRKVIQSVDDGELGEMVALG